MEDEAIITDTDLSPPPPGRRQYKNRTHHPRPQAPPGDRRAPPRTAADFAETLPSKPGKRSLNLSHQNRRLRGGDRGGATERMNVE